MTILELPIVQIGKALNIPIENRKIVFMLFDLNILGYSLLFLFWGFIGGLIGWIVGRIRKPRQV